MGTRPFSGIFGVEKIMGGCAKTAQQLACFFIFTKFMMPVWGNMMFNTADLVVYSPPGGNFWPSSMHESFVLNFISPLIPHRTWRLRGDPKVLVMGRMVSFLL